MWAITGLYLLALMTVLTLRVALTDEGLTQRWLFSRLQVKWSEVARVERMARAYALRDAKEPISCCSFCWPVPRSRRWQKKR